MTVGTDHMADLRQVLVQQYLLHEVEHHALEAGSGREHPPRVPVAHGLIDIYKCLHQGEFGVGHIIDQSEGFKLRLRQEMLEGAVPESLREPAVESLATDDRVLRVNLRALRTAFCDDAGRAADELAQVCIESAHVIRGVNTRFFDSLDAFMMLNRSGDIALGGHVFAFPSEWVETFLIELRELMRRIRQVPVLSHSESYRRLNRPAYRVVARSVLEASPLACILEK